MAGGICRRFVCLKSSGDLGYKKPWKLLTGKEINKRTLAKLANVSGSTLTKLAKGESVNMDILVRICTVLKCDLHGAVEFVPDNCNEVVGG
jgi:DNA-binding Xre family transcriptional regulator